MCDSSGLNSENDPLQVMTSIVVSKGVHKQNNSTGCINSDSLAIIIDNGASASITNDPDDLIAKPRKVQVPVTGISRDTWATLKGTILWKLESDDGSVHEFNYRSLSLQHMAQQMKDDTPIKDATDCAMLSKTMVLFWGQRKFNKTVQLHKKTNIGMTRTAPGISKYKNFIRECGKGHNHRAFDAHV